MNELGSAMEASDTVPQDLPKRSMSSSKSRRIADVTVGLVEGGRLAIVDLDEDPDGTFHADKSDFGGHHGFDRERLTEQLVRAGFANINCVDATTHLKGDLEFGLFVCTATKGA